MGDRYWKSRYDGARRLLDRQEEARSVRPGHPFGVTETEIIRP
jgi:hypothetical protein